MFRMTTRTFVVFYSAVSLVFTLLASVNSAAAQSTLYERLGGKVAVEAVTGGLVDRILQDKRVNAWFVHAAASPQNTAAYKLKLYEFVCEATGGPCKYTGLDMVSAHRGRRVTGEAFEAVVQHLTAVLDEARVPRREKDELLAVIAPLKSSIVQQ